MKKIYEFTSPCDGEEPLKVIFIAEEEEVLKNFKLQSKEDTLVVLSEDQEVVNAALERATEKHTIQ